MMHSMAARRGVFYLAAAVAAYGWYTRSKAKQTKRTDGHAAAGITNLPPGEEAEQQASLPPRGEAESVFSA